MIRLSTLALAAAVAALPVSNAAAYVIRIYDVSTSMVNLTQADAAIAGTPTATASASIIDFDDLGDATRGLFNINNPWPSNANATFAAHVTGTFNIGTAGSWTIGVNHDDGVRLTIDGTLIATADGLADNRTTTITSNFASGLHTVDIVFFENAGGASLEFFGRQGTTAPFELLVAVPEPTTLALLGLGLAGLAAARRRKQ
jgi:hypothetical protein